MEGLAPPTVFGFGEIIFNQSQVHHCLTLNTYILHSLHGIASLQAGGGLAITAAYMILIDYIDSFIHDVDS